MANLRISEEALIHLKAQDVDGWKVSAMPVRSVTEDLNQKIEDDNEEISYVFLHSEGNVLFRLKNGTYQVASCTANSPVLLLKRLCQICDASGIPYEAIGFEPA